VSDSGLIMVNTKYSYLGFGSKIVRGGFHSHFTVLFSWTGGWRLALSRLSFG
jgi:hypothetical protein